jgi:hypothetical protein
MGPGTLLLWLMNAYEPFIAGLTAAILMILAFALLAGDQGGRRRRK